MKLLGWIIEKTLAWGVLLFMFGFWVYLGFFPPPFLILLLTNVVWHGHCVVARPSECAMRLWQQDGYWLTLSSVIRCSSGYYGRQVGNPASPSAQRRTRPPSARARWPPASLQNLKTLMPIGGTIHPVTQPFYIVFSSVFQVTTSETVNAMNSIYKII